MNTKRTPFFALVPLFTVTVAARADKIDDYIKAEMQKRHLPAVSLAVIKDGKIVKVEGYGLANVANSRDPNAEPRTAPDRGPQLQPGSGT